MFVPASLLGCYEKGPVNHSPKGNTYFCTSGKLSDRHSVIPPLKRITCSNPALFNILTASADCCPKRHATMIGLALCLSNSATRLPNLVRGMWTESTIWPASKSFFSRMSSSTASERLISITACWQLTASPELFERCSTSAITSPTQSVARIQLFPTNSINCAIIRAILHRAIRQRHGDASTSQRAG
jgi:hypothetical protein